ncbi:beta-ketoacyl-[acyl-carrier-protein] synthase family protein [Pseudoalteromonas sp. NEC-BIFX-2020_015]|uniref:beta-ketoacyl-[acyl-carrier-protein] synthase family protein n=1 Tax=Pseudoalteromonas sp. NEC-BIFX-2020_015 TaxID=2729544 RepID=UPI00146150F7|nr:beta-ketoacyl-[acyl-carrier-protein] synthase family protein [Pseudoalteromonas sp. NEC-BIFX-2020_015]NMR24269.1 beta-ketoacyl-[acyl-carrier-protein] synthase family protein [Pseudoalteromonas sp. NEC-BIFX-2020_015]
MHKVVITGIGMTVSEHRNPHTLFATLKSGQSLIKEDQALAAMGIHGVASSRISEQEVTYLQQQYAFLQQSKIAPSGFIGFDALSQSIVDAGLDKGQIRQAGLYFGTNKTLPTTALLHQLAGPNRATSQLNESTAYYNPQTVFADMVKHFGIAGPHASCADACAAGASSVISGYREIASGALDIAMCGAADFGTQPVMQLLFKKIGALNQGHSFTDSSAVSRPFDRDRAGVVLADGAAFVVIESETSALRRGAKIYAYISGAYRCTESYKMTSTEPSGKYYAECMETALAKSGVAAGDIDHISAHGTSTKSNDSAESLAIAKVFGSTTAVTSTKSALGHSLAGSGAIEVVLSALSLKNQVMLPTLNFSALSNDDGEINVVTKATAKKMNYILSNSFGFGGVNTSIVLARESRC